MKNKKLKILLTALTFLFASFIPQAKAEQEVEISPKAGYYYYQEKIPKLMSLDGMMSSWELDLSNENNGGLDTEFSFSYLYGRVQYKSPIAGDGHRKENNTILESKVLIGERFYFGKVMVGLKHFYQDNDGRKIVCEDGSLGFGRRIHQIFLPISLRKKNFTLEYSQLLYGLVQEYGSKYNTKEPFKQNFGYGLKVSYEKDISKRFNVETGLDFKHIARSSSVKKDGVNYVEPANFTLFPYLKVGMVFR